MKATGIVRRIDELGRVVIPKEIRRTQRIRRGDPLEIFTTGDGEVIFKKYSPVGELSSVTTQYVDALSNATSPKGRGKTSQRADAAESGIALGSPFGGAGKAVRL